MYKTLIVCAIALAVPCAAQSTTSPSMHARVAAEAGRDRSPHAGVGFAIASEQVTDELQPGARVRVRAPGVIAGQLTGMIIRRTRDTVAIVDGRGMQIAIPLSALSSVEISRGKDRGAGAIRGLEWGAGIGLVSGIVSASGLTSEDSLTKASAIIGGTFGGAVIGVGIGAIIGREHWDRFQLPVQVAMGVQRRRLSLGFSVPLPTR